MYPATAPLSSAVVRVLVVDDSAMVREVLRRGLSLDPCIEVVGVAASAAQASEMLETTAVDVMTLDLQMPKVDGLSFLREVMATRPMPVVVISASTHSGAAKTLEAMEAGAVDIIGKPRVAVGGGLDTIMQELCQRVRAAAQARVRPGRRELPRPTVVRAPTAPNAAGVPTENAVQYSGRGAQLIAVGASTGGVQALTQVLSDLPLNMPPIVIVQHMPEGFTRAFAARLNAVCALHVAEAQDGDLLKPGQVLIAPGGTRHMRITGRAPFWRIELAEGPHVTFSRPSVDVMFRSVAERAGPLAAAALLTGMGRDGAEGMSAICRTGAMTIAQDEGSSVVWGMPSAAVELGAARQVLAIDRIGPALIEAAAPAQDARPAMAGALNPVPSMRS